MLALGGTQSLKLYDIAQFFSTATDAFADDTATVSVRVSGLGSTEGSTVSINTMNLTYDVDTGLPTVGTTPAYHGFVLAAGYVIAPHDVNTRTTPPSGAPE